MPSVPQNPPSPGWEPLGRKGKPFRADVRAAVPAVWNKVVNRARKVLGDAVDVPELMRSTVMQVSRYLDRVTAQPYSRNAGQLLVECFQRRLQRCAIHVVRSLAAKDGSASESASLSKQFGEALADLSQREEGKRVTPKHRWPKSARELVLTNRKARGSELRKLLETLAEVTGNTRQACLRFVHRLGIPAQRSYKTWTKPQQQHLLSLVELHPIAEVARIMNRSQNSVRAMLKRLGGNATMGKDWFSKYTLAEALHVSPAKVQQWIDRGWLEVRMVESGETKRTVIDADEFCKFCKTHRNEIIGNRLHRDRLEFVLNFVFPPAHAEMLPVRTPYGPRAAKQPTSRDTAEDVSGKNEPVGDEMDDDVA